MKKQYLKIDPRNNGIETLNATQAMRWHRSGGDIAVYTVENGTRRFLRCIDGATQKPARDENRDYCKRVADELDSYDAGDARRCPNCGEIIARDWYDVGDRFRCPCCHDVADTDDWEALSLWDYLNDTLDMEWVIDSSREYKAARFWVTLGGPSVWIDTEKKAVCLRWGGEYAEYGLLWDTAEAVDEIAAEMWEMDL